MNNWLLRKSPKPGLYEEPRVTLLRQEEAPSIDAHKDGVRTLKRRK